jgi:hypothetical protein
MGKKAEGARVCKRSEKESSRVANGWLTSHGWRVSFHIAHLNVHSTQNSITRMEWYCLKNLIGAYVNLSGVIHLLGLDEAHCSSV